MVFLFLSVFLIGVNVLADNDYILLSDDHFHRRSLLPPYLVKDLQTSVSNARIVYFDCDTESQKIFYIETREDADQEPNYIKSYSIATQSVEIIRKFQAGHVIHCLGLDTRLALVFYVLDHDIRVSGYDGSADRLVLASISIRKAFGVYALQKKLIFGNYENGELETCDYIGNHRRLIFKLDLISNGMHLATTLLVVKQNTGIVYGSNGKRVFSMNIDGSGFKYIFDNGNTSEYRKQNKTTQYISIDVISVSDSNLYLLSKISLNDSFLTKVNLNNVKEILPFKVFHRRFYWMAFYDIHSIKGRNVKHNSKDIRLAIAIYIACSLIFVIVFASASAFIIYRSDFPKPKFRWSSFGVALSNTRDKLRRSVGFGGIRPTAQVSWSNIRRQQRVAGDETRQSYDQPIQIVQPAIEFKLPPTSTEHLKRSQKR